RASEIAQDLGSVSACTDITGFGLIGHALEMIKDSETGFIIDSHALPIIDGTKELAMEGFLPGGLYRNKKFYLPHTEIVASADEFAVECLFDPQTSGGLFISLPLKQAQEMLRVLQDEGFTGVAIVGSVTDNNAGRIKII
ncbi:MAG: selenide, water dikinase SelD, partial [Deltaproteobacteria bacterium]|nr:selenide, water dikinase SelD [Deltaproteobacteria bacterium]